MFGKALGRTLMLLGAAFVVYLGIVLVNGTISAVSTSSASSSRAAAVSGPSGMLARGRPHR